MIQLLNSATEEDIVRMRGELVDLHGQLTSLLVQGREAAYASGWAAGGHAYHMRRGEWYAKCPLCTGSPAAE